MRLFGFLGLLGAVGLVGVVAGPAWARCESGRFVSVTNRVECPSFALVDASGVPGFRHTYRLRGLCKLEKLTVDEGQICSREVKGTAWADAGGIFDRKTGEVHETVKFSQGLSGSINSLLRCTGDPWLGPSACTVESENVSVGPKWGAAVSKRVMNDKLPFSRGPVSLSEAESDSRKHGGSASAAPPPPPPAPTLHAMNSSRMELKATGSEVPALPHPISEESRGGKSLRATTTIHLNPQLDPHSRPLQRKPGSPSPKLPAVQQKTKLPAVQQRSTLPAVQQPTVKLNPQSELP